jgi:hypothetical protein
MDNGNRNKNSNREIDDVPGILTKGTALSIIPLYNVTQNAYCSHVS